MGARLDPILVELVRNSFLSVCEEMAESLVRSSHSPNIKERRDCSCGLYTPDGRMAVQAEHIPVHLGVMPHALQHILEKFPPETMRPGDSFVVNDPYFGGNHLPDLIVAGPLFIGDTPIGFAASMAHHNDVGGLAPRSMPATATEIFQEGLRIPPIRLTRSGVAIDDVVQLIATNSRTPIERTADLRAQISTVRLAQRRMDELSERYTPEQLLGALGDLLERSEEAMRAAIKALPDETWTATSEADYGGELLPIHVSIRKDGSDLLFDFSGTAEQTKSPFNSCLSNTYACLYMALRITLAEGIPANDGLYRTLRLKAPEGSIVNPSFPAAVSAATQVSYHTFEALMRALRPLAPNRVFADSGGAGVFSFGGRDPRSGSLFAYGEAIGGGSGASIDCDGESAVMPPISNLHDTPVESLELSMPVRIERYELVEGSGGTGLYRGGLGFRRSFRMLAPVQCSFQLSMSHRPPQGLAGGNPGRPTHIHIEYPDGAARTITRFCEEVVPAGSLVVIEGAGGGGYGPFADRLPEFVKADREGGYVLADA